MLLPFETLCQLWGEPLMAPGTIAPESFGSVSTDSRGDLAGALFVPLVGETFDGHRFVAGAFSAGAAAALLQKGRLEGADLAELVASGGRPIWLVEDTLVAYQQLALLWRRRLGLAVVAVTGSAGKTTTRELIKAALASLGPVVASSGNENNDVGVPLTLLKADDTTAALVVEMGMRGLGEIDRLTRCADPDVAVITNIGTAHIGRLGSREAIGQAKCEITTGLGPDGVLVIPAGDPLLEQSLGTVWGGRVVRIALEDELAGFPAGMPAADLVGRLEDPRLTLAGGESLRLPLEGRHNARNLLLAVAVAQELGVPAAALGDLAVELPGGRARRWRLGGVELLDETYNASPEAVLAALDLLAATGAAGGGAALRGAGHDARAGGAQPGIARSGGRPGRGAGPRWAADRGRRGRSAGDGNRRRRDAAAAAGGVARSGRRRAAEMAGAGGSGAAQGQPRGGAGAGDSPAGGQPRTSHLNEFQPCS